MIGNMRARKIKKITLDGDEFVVQELTFGQTSDINDKTMTMNMDDPANSKIDMKEHALLRILHGTKEPILTREMILDMPAMIADELADAINDLNPVSEKKLKAFEKRRGKK